mmetsp:Transcript_36083/g.56127  ORF Transcript_36083/g.56127 Transcript_36083/m.56127 type:complete len:454 (-) Transcript_36083:162-1523(-)
MKRPAGRFGEDDGSVAVDKPARSGRPHAVVEKPCAVAPTTGPSSARPQELDKQSSLLPLEFSIYKYYAPVSGLTFVEANGESASEKPGAGASEFDLSGRSAFDMDKLADEGNWEALLLKSSKKHSAGGIKEAPPLLKPSRATSLGDVAVESASKKSEHRPEVIPESPSARESISTATRSQTPEQVQTPVFSETTGIPGPPQTETPGTATPGSATPGSSKVSRRKKTRKSGTPGKKRKKKASTSRGESLSPAQSKKKGTKKKKQRAPTSAEPNEVEPKKVAVAQKADERPIAPQAPKAEEPRAVPQAPKVEPPSREVAFDYVDDNGVDWDFSVADGINSVMESSLREAFQRLDTEKTGHKPMLEHPYQAGILGYHASPDPSTEFQVVSDTEEVERQESAASLKDKNSKKRNSSKNTLFSKLWRKSGIKTLRCAFVPGDRISRDSNSTARDSASF